MKNPLNSMYSGNHNGWCDYLIIQKLNSYLLIVSNNEIRMEENINNLFKNGTFYE